jgi:dihydrolipoamide dehydrogenase
LNVGCIPSKALLHAAKVVDEAHEMETCGISFGAPKIDVPKLVDWKKSVINKLTTGLKGMAKMRQVEVVQGVAQFESANQLSVTKDGEKTLINFDNCIIAAGSRPVNLPFLPEDPRILDSTSALNLEFAKAGKRMLVIGGGIIGLEMATVYDALGVKVSVVEFADQLIPAADKDLVQVLHKRLEKRYENIWLKTKVTKVEAKKEGLYVIFEGENAPAKAEVLILFSLPWAARQMELSWQLKKLV